MFKLVETKGSRRIIEAAVRRATNAKYVHLDQFTAEAVHDAFEHCLINCDVIVLLHAEKAEKDVLRAFMWELSSVNDADRQFYVVFDGKCNLDEAMPKIGVALPFVVHQPTI